MNHWVTTALLLTVLVLFQAEAPLVRFGLLGEGAPPLALFALASLGILAFTLIILGKRTKILPRELFLALTIPVLHLPIVYFNASDEVFLGGFRLSIQMLLMLGVCLCLETTRWTARAVADIRWALNIYGAVTAALIIHSYFNPFFYFEYGEVYDIGIRRAFGFIGDQGGWIMAFMSIVAIAERRMLLSLLFISALMVTAQVGALLMLLVGLLILLAVTRASVAKWATYTLLVSLFVIIPLYIYGNKIPAVSRYLDGVLLEEGGSLSMRLSSLTFGWELYRQFPLLGGGFGTFSYRMAELDPVAYLATPAVLSNASNQILQSLYEYGALVFCVALANFVFLMRKFMRRVSVPGVRGSTKGVLAGVMALIVGNQSSVYFLPSLLFTITLIYFCLAFIETRPKLTPYMYGFRKAG